MTLDGKPAAGIPVRLPRAEYDPEQKRPLTATTDAEGKYEFAEVAPGRYFLAPYAPGYTGPNLGWGFAGSHVSVAPGEAVKNVDVALERGGAVTGRVTDGEGRPLVRLPVYLFNTDASGKKQIVQVPNMQFMMTDDRGVYRIYGVPSGKYFVAVGKTDQQLPMVPTDLGRDYPLTYYPGTTNEAEAKEVAVAGSGEAAGVNIAVGSRGLTFAVSGRVVVPEHGAPAASYWLVYGKYTEGQKDFVPTNFGGAVSADGRFRIEGVGAGDYGVALAAQPGTPGAGYSDVTPVRVTDADVADVEITVRSGATVAGAVVMEDPPDPSMRDSHTKFQIIGTVSTMGDQGAAPIPAQAAIGRDGTFTLSGLRPGSVKLWLNDFNAPKGFSILRIERDGVPIANGFEIGDDEAISGVRVVIGYGTGVVRGQVVFKNGSVPKKHELFAVASRVGGADNPRPFRVDERGQFVIEGLAPGDYKISLILLPDPVTKVFGFEPDPGQTVSVANGGSASVTLTIDFDAVQIVEKPRW